MTGLVSLVGAGPGHPELLTLRAVACLSRADLVVYDRLVPEAMLAHAPPQAQRVAVPDLAPTHAQRCQPVHELLIDAARRGQRVVRLKGGDPLIFGRGGEEAQALHAAGVPFEVVPGVTAAAAAAAFAGIPLTHRDHASAVAFVTGHEQRDKGELAIDWKGLAHFPGTLAIYMGMARLETIVNSLLDGGMNDRTPAAAVELASLGVQRTVTAPLREFAEAVRAENLAAPVLMLIGPTVALRNEVAWFEKLPLFGRRILVTRPRHQSGDLARRLAEWGAEPVVLPTVEIHEPADWSPVDAALRGLERYHWIVFTSANGVLAFLERLRSVGRDLRSLGSVKLAAIGPKTAATLRERGLDPDLVPARFQSEDLAAALQQAIAPGQRVLLARADRGRELLRDELTGHCQVEQVAVYSQVDAVTLDERVVEQLRCGRIDCITLTSANIARSLLRRLDDACLGRIRSGHLHLVTISPVTSTAVAEFGLPVAAEATTATIEGVLEALVRLAAT